MKSKITKKELRKFIFRWMVVNVVFFMVKLTMEPDEKAFHGLLSPTSFFYYVTAFTLFMLTWEINDHLLKRYKKHYRLNSLESLKIVGINLGIMLPVAALVYYLGLFPLKEPLGIVCADPNVQFLTDFLRATLLAVTVIFFNMFYHALNQQTQLEKEMENLKRDMLASRYTSLKNQISPHFLFNSLNTLTFLMYEDRDLASDFVTRLASTYRYILDNREHDLVSLKKELNFLDSFIFMMDIRHKKAVVIKLDINIDTQKFQIPTLSLQMLVENALKHNRYSKEKPLRLKISSIQEDALAIRNTLWVRKKKEGATGLGLQNIKNRYAFYTNKQVLVRQEADFFEVILPLLDSTTTQSHLKAIL